ncbi:MAG: hypothetical protein Q8K85_01720 [Hyphomicrobium sp.]|nr:hypothetical protein [Hyphomicrobium sp.]
MREASSQASVLRWALDHLAAELAERPAGVERAQQLAAQGVDNEHRRNGEGRAEKHHLADRRDVAQLAHERRHRGEHEGRDDLEADGGE